MKTFDRYVWEMDNNALGELGSEGNDESLMRIARTAIKNHFTDLMRFYEGLAEKDASIKHELEEYKSDPKNRSSKLPNANDGDITHDVVPPEADGSGAETEDD